MSCPALAVVFGLMCKSEQYATVFIEQCYWRTQAQARATFNSIDRDGDGCIKPDEIADVVKCYSPKAKRNEIQSCLAVIQVIRATPGSRTLGSDII